MELKTTIVSAVMAFGISAFASQIDLRGGKAAPPVVTPQPGVAAASASYASLLEDIDQRVGAMQKRASARPDDWLIRMNLGTVLLERAGLSNQIEDYERVQAVLDDAFAIAPAGSGPLLLAARFNFSIHRLDAAEEYLDMIDRRSVPRRDDQVIGRVLRAEIAAQRGQYELAFNELTAVAAVEPAAANAELALYHARTGNPVQAEALLAATLESTRTNDPRRRAWIKLQLGIIAMDRGELKLALDHLQAADGELAGWWLVQEHIAEVHNRRNNHARSTAIYEDLVRTADLPQHMDALAGLYRHMGEPERAAELIARAGARWDQQIARLPESAMGHGLQHHLQFGTPERALELALANHAVRPGGDAQVALARAYLQAGQPAEALAVAERALATPYRTARLHDVAAKAHAALGHTAAAEDQASLRLAINPWYSSDDHSH
jgi:tetratricopeptide (TPR) repeat protein